MKKHRFPFSTEMLGRHNTVTIMKAIQAYGPITKPDILRKTGLSFSTILRVTEKLIQSEIVVEAGLEASTGGRRSILLKLNEISKVVIGVDMGGTKIFSGLVGLPGNILTKIEVKVDRSSPQASLNQLFEIIDQLILKAKELNVNSIGIGVGVPGVTDTDSGRILVSPSLAWNDLPLKTLLNDRFHMPIVVENDVNMMALGEYGYGVGRRIRNMILIAYGTGVGSGIIIDGSLYKGSTYSAGEIGHLIPGRNFLHKNYELSYGALELVSSGSGIAQRANEYRKAESGSLPQKLTSKEVFDFARRGEDWALKLVDEVVDYITISVANSIVILDPEAVIFSGGIFKSADLLLEPIKERLKGLIPMHPKILLSELGPRAGIMGAAHQVLSKVVGS